MFGEPLCIININSVFENLKIFMCVIIFKYVISSILIVLRIYINIINLLHTQNISLRHPIAYIHVIRFVFHFCFIFPQDSDR